MNDIRHKTHTHTHAHAKNLFSRTFCTSRKCGDYGYLKIRGMANTSSAISGLQIDVIEKIQRGFEEYDFDLKILNWATRITRFTCPMFLSLTASFLRIFYEIENLKKKKKMWKCVYVDFDDCTWKLHLSASIFFFVFISSLVCEISGVKIWNEFFCLKWSNSAKEKSYRVQ